MEYLRIFDSKTGGRVDLHPLHGADELPGNSEVARILAEFGHAVKLLPTIAAADKAARRQWLADVIGNKNPDVRIDDRLIGDIKTPNRSIAVKQATINRCTYACAQQKVAIAIINLVDREYAVRDIKNGIIGALQPGRNKTIQEVWVLTAQRNIFKINRAMVFDESIYEALSIL